LRPSTKLAGIILLSIASTVIAISSLCCLPVGGFPGLSGEGCDPLTDHGGTGDRLASAPDFVAGTAVGNRCCRDTAHPFAEEARR
jgi:hypothetical protein